MYILSVSIQYEFRKKHVLGKNLTKMTQNNPTPISPKWVIPNINTKIWPKKKTTLLGDHDYSIPTKFHQNSSSVSGEEVQNVTFIDRRTMHVDISSIEPSVQVREKKHAVILTLTLDLHEVLSETLKLTCRHINRRNIVFKYLIYLCAPITLNKCHACFICMVFTELWATVSKHKKSEWKYVPPTGLSHQRAIAFQHATLIIRDIQRRLVNLFQYIFTLLSINTCDNASMKLIMVWFVHTKFCKQ